MNMDLFASEIRLINNLNVKKLVWQCLENAPDYFWVIPSSSTGKYHPKDENTNGGLVLHIKRAVKVAVYLCECLSIKDVERDCVIAACIMHDLCFPKGTTVTVLSPTMRKHNTRYQKDKIKKELQYNTMQKKIEDIKEGDKVLSWNGKEKEWDVVTKTFKRKASSFVNLKLSNGNILRCTENHPIAVIKKEGINWVEAKDIEEQDELLQYKYNSLGLRLFNLSKKMSWEEFYGNKKAQKIRKKTSVSQKKRCNTAVEKKNRSVRALELWQNDEYIKKQIESGCCAFGKSFLIGQNGMSQSVEKKISYALRNICPGEFKYNGDGRLGIFMNGHRPDFVNVNGKKKLIEGYGCYWHGCDLCGFSGDEAGKKIKEKDIKRLTKSKDEGYETLVIWEHDLNNNMDDVKNEIKTFVYNPNVEIVRAESKFFDCREEDVYNIETKKNHNFFAYGILVHNCKNGYPKNEGHTVDGHGYLWTQLVRNILTKNEIKDSPSFSTISRLILMHMGKYDLPYVLDWDDELATIMHLADYISSREDIIVNINIDKKV